MSRRNTLSWPHLIRETCGQMLAASLSICLLPPASERWGKVIFSVCPHLRGGGVPHPRSGLGKGVPHPRSGLGVPQVPPLARSEWWGYLARSGCWGVPRVSPRPGLYGRGYPGGYQVSPWPGLNGGGTPWPGLNGGGYPIPGLGWGGGTPSQVWGGGYPIPGLNGGYPPGQVWMVGGTWPGLDVGGYAGYPPTRSGWWGGHPPPTH